MIKRLLLPDGHLNGMAAFNKHARPLPQCRRPTLRLSSFIAAPPYLMTMVLPRKRCRYGSASDSTLTRSNAEKRCRACGKGGQKVWVLGRGRRSTQRVKEQAAATRRLHSQLWAAPALERTSAVAGGAAAATSARRGAARLCTGRPTIRGCCTAAVRLLGSWRGAAWAALPQACIVAELLRPLYRLLQCRMGRSRVQPAVSLSPKAHASPAGAHSSGSTNTLHNRPLTAQSRLLACLLASRSWS